MKCLSNGVPFADNVFDDGKMRNLPKYVCKAVAYARDNYTDVPEKELNVYAEALCEWALSKGVTRYTHWFQPLNNCTAGKRDCLFSIDKNYDAVLKFRGKELAKGEGDASSFPSGGMRRIYEARGLTRWDCASYPFIKDGCLYIPCTFCGAGGEVLDKKTPLLRSCKALDIQAVRVLRALGESVRHVYGVVGAEQEYFLVDKEIYLRRADLAYTGRTLFGAKPPKGQEFDDHYFRPPNSRVTRFMQTVDEELWKLGIVVKTEHNEVAPHQCELAPCYTRANLASDYDQLTMDVLKRAADDNGLTCLLHEKPFRYINGSGKHNNWSMMTDTDDNLLEAGDTPRQNARFLLMLAAVVKAVDDYSELLLAAISSHGNDCRLGGYEAPPNVLTVFLGAPLSRAISIATNGKWRYGVDILPEMPKNTDRNRTSPFAFTGNKFEFRSVGSSASVADVNTALHVAVAESLRQFADRLEHAPNVYKSVGEIVCETFAKHKRIIFDGNNYSPEWAAEAKLRSLKSYSCPDATLALTNARNVNVLARHGVLTRREIAARQQIMSEDYVNTVCAEGRTAVCICKNIFGSVEKYIRDLSQTAQSKSALGCDCQTELAVVEKLTALLRSAHMRLKNLQRQLALKDSVDDPTEQAVCCRDGIIPALDRLRIPIDKMEQLCPANIWALPSYGEILFDVKC